MTTAQQVVSSIRSAKQLLFVIHEYLPLPLALWVPAMVSSLKEQGKSVTVLIAQEAQGWLAQIDKYYPTDMMVQLEQLRQEISIPYSGEELGDLSYAVENGAVKLTLVPNGDPLDVSKLSAKMQGNSFDTVIAVGITGKHPIFAELNRAMSSLAHAEFCFIGSAIQQNSAQQQLQFAKNISTIEGISHDFLEEVLVGTTNPDSMSDAVREAVVLFFHSQAQMYHRQYYPTQRSHQYLSNLLKKNTDVQKMAKVFEHEQAALSSIFQTLLSTQTSSDDGKVIVAGLNEKQISSLGYSILDVMRALYYLPKYDEANAVAVILSESEYAHHVFVSGDKNVVKQAALKYAFPYTDLVTGGYVTEVNFSKLSQDLTRVLGSEEIVPQVSTTQASTEKVEKTESTQKNIPTIPVEDEDIDAEPIPAPVPKPQQKKTSPSLDEVLANTQMSQPVEKNEDGVPLPPPTVPKMDAPPKPPVVEPQVSPSLPDQKPTVSKLGLDFATIAKKMRESMGKNN